MIDPIICGFRICEFAHSPRLICASKAKVDRGHSQISIDRVVKKLSRLKFTFPARAEQGSVVVSARVLESVLFMVYLVLLFCIFVLYVDDFAV